MGNGKKAGIAAGATILIASNFIVKMIGLLYKIPLGNILGNTGNGYLNSAYEIYTLLLTVFSGGGTVVVSRLIAESNALGRYREARKVFRLMLASFFFVGVAGSLIMYFGAGAFADKLGNPPAALSIMALAPAIFFLAVSSAFRGFFQGHGNMRPTGTAQITEAAVKLLSGVLIAVLISRAGRPIEEVSAGAISGTLIGAAVGTAVVIFLYIGRPERSRINRLAREDRSEVRSAGKLLGIFWKMVIPVSLSAVVLNLTGVLDLFLLYDRLAHIGLSRDAVNAAYGGYKGYAQTLFNLAPSIIASVNISIIPALSAAFARRDYARARSVTVRAMKIVMILALPCAAGLVVLAGPIQRLLFPARLDEIAAVTPLLQILGAASVWTCLSTLSTALLQSMGKMRFPIISLIAGGAVKLVTNYILVGTEGIGIIGAPIGTLLCYIVMFGLNAACLKRSLPFKLRFVRVSAVPLISSVLMAGYAWGAQRLLSWAVGGKAGDMLATGIAVLTAALLYFYIMLALGGIRERDILLLPGGAVIARILKKLRLLDGSGRPDRQKA